MATRMIVTPVSDVTVDDSPVNGRSAAIPGQQRCVDVDHAGPRNLEEAVGNQPSVCGDDADVGRPVTQRLGHFRLLEALRLDDGSPRSAASALTGASVTFWPRPRGRSGWVTTPHDPMARVEQRRNVGTANCGVPKNDDYHLPARVSFLILRTIRSFCRPRSRSMNSVPSR